MPEMGEGWRMLVKDLCCSELIMSKDAHNADAFFHLLLSFLSEVSRYQGEVLVNELETVTNVLCCVSTGAAWGFEFVCPQPEGQFASTENCRIFFQVSFILQFLYSVPQLSYSTF